MATDDPRGARRIFGLALRQRRLARGWTQEQLSHETGIRQSYLSEVEAGRRNISIDNIQRLARALDWPIAEFFRQGEMAQRSKER